MPENKEDYEIQWEEYCPQVDEVLNEYATKVSGAIDRWVEDTPSRVLRWQHFHPGSSDPVNYSISLLLTLDNNPVVKFNAAGSLDDERSLTRFMMQSDEHILHAPVLIDTLRRLIHGYGDFFRVFYQDPKTFEPGPGPTNDIVLHYRQAKLPPKP